MDGHWQEKPYKTEPSVQVAGAPPWRNPAPKYYKPIAHRTFSISFLFIASLALIGLVEYSLRKLPHHDVSSRHTPHRAEKRQLVPTATPAQVSFQVQPVSFLRETTTNAELAKSTSTTRSPSTYLNNAVRTSTLTNPPPDTYTSVTASAAPPGAYLNPGVSTFSVKDEPSSLSIESDIPLTFVKEPVNYFYAIYFPILLAVLFRMLIGYLYTTTKMVEPFSMLSRPGGVLAKDFLWINYLSPNETLDPFSAMFRGHWLMLWMGILYSGAQILSPLSAEMFGVYPSFHKVNDKIAVGGAAFWVHPQMARLMQGILSFACVMLISIWLLLRKTPSHIYSDPSSLAGIGSLIHHPDTVQRFANLDQHGAKRAVIRSLRHKRFRLGFYQAYDHTERYGIISDPVTSNDETITHALRNFTPGKSRMKGLRIQFALNTILVLITAALFAVVIAYHFNSADNRFERFMNAESFGPRFILTLAGIIIKSQWARLERRGVVFEPFYNSYKSPVFAERTILAARPLIPISTLMTSLHRCNFFQALVAFTALLAEVLIIVLPGIPFDAGQIYLAALISRYVCFGILGFMTLVMVALCVRMAVQWKTRPRLPKDPNTIGAMMMYLAGTRMADNVGGLATCSGRDMKRELASWRRRVALTSRESNGAKRWVIDFDDGMGGI